MGRPLLLLTAAALAPSPWTASSGCGPCFLFRFLSSPLYLGRPPHGCGPCSFSRLQPLPHQLGPPSHGCGPCFLLWLQPLPPLLGVPPHGITYGRPLTPRLYATATPAMALTSPGTSALGSADAATSWPHTAASRLRPTGLHLGLDACGALSTGAFGPYVFGRVVSAPPSSKRPKLCFAGGRHGGGRAAKAPADTHPGRLRKVRYHTGGSATPRHKPYDRPCFLTWSASSRLRPLLLLTAAALAAPAWPAFSRCGPCFLLRLQPLASSARCASSRHNLRAGRPSVARPSLPGRPSTEALSTWHVSALLAA